MKRRTLLLLLGAALLAALGIITVARTLSHPNAVSQLRASIAELRAAADSCTVALDASQHELLEYNARLDSMRERVRGMESLPPRGVPADSYDIYLRLFGLYNDSARAWEGRVEALRAERDECRIATDRHNEAVDSLRRLLRDAPR